MPSRRAPVVFPSRLELWLITLIGLVPAGLYFWYGAHNQLGADPVNVFERWLGLWGVRFLVVTLAIAPLRDLGVINLVRYRRTFGLLVFWYAVMHVATYGVLDQHLDLRAVFGEVTTKPFLMVGLAAFVLLCPLAATSNRWSIRTLGRLWGTLHRGVYVVAALAGVHFLMAFKTYTVTSVGYAAALFVLGAAGVVRRVRHNGRRRMSAANEPMRRPKTTG
ncbi:sulfite oxidase subunit YedZ [Ameyamaea chiangmaiensis NBRC 103196]|uniref:Protein-methionine-sulfoxide reductase heme-binding subunit MsrQ n=1 Tax=Ameyamaea chiangmaiensis TaxID=442969 RepID=A0A850PDD1_9PROT|nr:protein-methionine-sulfoxide reductase heme-binding subunit MsrQ [Ameyamaea chiangmaiensis]MBS4074404.1 protein-methionine-sulfoxide reductase heme-binding subunit MsrQ [Ameyamaea chiangmaiensis]NVN40490.1 protein-methionine-sulfoxide reductase heme-binding subunit MsrQ [Ameyamaea chiangmaiensis]GBQ71915.1 sulfite oxidase subunit YedZ [Ameyamaea chiangmaiensis NBRC 103196]